MRLAMILTVLIALSVSLMGCGETVSGVGKDVNRMSRGVNTFLFRQR